MKKHKLIHLLRQLTDANQIPSNPKLGQSWFEDNKLTFMRDEDDYVCVFVDGSCIKNGTRTAVSGYGICFGGFHPLNTAKVVRSNEQHTNNRAELQAAIEALKICIQNGEPKVNIHSDSECVVNGTTDKLMKNLDIWDQMQYFRTILNVDIKFTKVKGHHDCAC